MSIAIEPVRLRVVWPKTPDTRPPTAQHVEAAERTSAGGLSPQSTLSEFYRRFFEPCVLRDQWLLIPAEIFKGHQRDVLVYVPKVALEMVRRLPVDERLFPWPCALRTVQNQLKLLRDLSAMPAEEKHGGVHRLRARLLTTLAQHNPLVAKYQAGHSIAGDVLLEHYVAGQQFSTWPDLMERLPRLRMPDWFGYGERQLRLFLERFCPSPPAQQPAVRVSLGAGGVFPDSCASVPAPGRRCPSLFGPPGAQAMVLAPASPARFFRGIPSVDSQRH